MSAGKGLRLPAILSANALLGGHVVYRTADGWSPRLAEAAVAPDEEALTRLQAVRDEALRGEEVIAPELIPVAIDGAGRVVPGHVRERIRALGPTVRRDLGPQSVGEHQHVSL
jgi:hypothetical protein